MSDYHREVVSLGDNASEMLYEACKLTWPNRQGKFGEVEAGVDHFRGARTWSDAPLFDVPKPKGLVNCLDNDGIGTKVLVSQRTSRYDAAAFDLLAMGADDPASKGFEPVVFVTDLNVNTLDGHEQHMEQLALGAVQAAKIGRMAMFGGETAVLGDIIKGYGSPQRNLHFVWGAAIVAKGHRERVIDGHDLEAGMALVGLYEPGFRSNGISKVRDIAREQFGNRWHDRKIDFSDGQKKLGEAVLRGSTIYTPVLVDAIGGFDLRVKPQAKVAGVAHISGGGLFGKLGDLLSVQGLGADISEPFDTPEAMQLIQAAGEMPDDVMYGIWHGGHGMVVATSKPKRFIKVAAQNGVEAKEVGEVTKKRGIRLRSAGAQAPGKKLKHAA